MASNFSRTIWSERGMDISKLETTDIPKTIRCLKWDNFILPPPQYHSEIVRDFYAALVPETFKESGTVFVRGHKVVITAKLINEHFCIREVPEYNFMDCRNRIEFLCKSDPKFVSRLRWDTSNQSLELLYEELHPGMALWTKFINHNLIPSKQTIITPEVARILFSIKNGYPIDVGRLIHTQICDANDSGSSLLPFPSLITHFCRLSSVTWDSGDLCPPLADLGRVSYNSFAQEQGLPTLPLMKCDRVPKIEVQPQGQVPATPFQPQVRVPAMLFQPPGRPLTTPWQARAPMTAVQPQSRAPTTAVQPQGQVSVMPVQLQMGRVPATPFQPQGRVPPTPVQPPGRPLITPWQGRVPATPVQPPGRPLTTPWHGRPPMTAVQPQVRPPTTAVQPQGRVSAMPVQLQHGNTDRPKWVNEITGLLNSLSDTVVGQYNALSTQINNLGMRVTSLENALRDEEFEDLDSQSHRRVRRRPTE